MQARTAVTGTVIAAAAVLGLIGCSNEPSQEEIADRCIKAVDELEVPPHADDPRPAACEGLDEEDYHLVILRRGLQDKDLMPDQ